MNRRAIGLVGLLLAILLLVAVILGLAYISLSIIREKENVPMPGTFRIESYQFLKTPTQTVLVVTITNLGPGSIVWIELRIANESYCYDLSDDPLQPNIQRSFTQTLKGEYQFGQSYLLIVRAEYSNGTEHEETMAVKPSP